MLRSSAYWSLLLTFSLASKVLSEGIPENEAIWWESWCNKNLRSSQYFDFRNYSIAGLPSSNSLNFSVSVTPKTLSGSRYLSAAGSYAKTAWLEHNETSKVTATVLILEEIRPGTGQKFSFRVIARFPDNSRLREAWTYDWLDVRKVDFVKSVKWAQGKDGFSLFAECSNLRGDARIESLAKELSQSCRDSWPGKMDLKFKSPASGRTHSVTIPERF